MWWTVLLVLLYVLDRTDGARRCRKNEFFNLQLNRCQVCTVCKDGQALRRTCSKTNDTLCGMINFSFLDNSKDGKYQHVPNDDYSFHFTEERPKPNSHGENTEPTNKAPYVLSQENEREWKNLAFALIAVLSVLIILTTTLVLIICYKVRHTGWFCKSVTGIDQEEAENGYVVIHRFVPIGTPPGAEASTSAPASPPQATVENLRNQNRRYRPYLPKRRLMNEYTDEVFDSEDSAGSRSLRSMLETIPEKSEGS